MYSIANFLRRIRLLNSESILSQIDEEIARLQQVRALLAGGGVSTGITAKKAGRPKKTKHTISPEGRKRIAEAVKRRWAKQKAGK